MVVVQPVGVLLKFSLIKVVEVAEFEVALDVKFTLPPIQIAVALGTAVTAVGAAVTVIVPVAFTVPHPPVNGIV